MIHLPPLKSQISNLALLLFDPLRFSAERIGANNMSAICSIFKRKFHGKPNGFSTPAIAPLLPFEYD